MLRKIPDWIIYGIILTVILVSTRPKDNRRYDSPPPPPTIGPALPNASPYDPNVIVNIERARSGVGTAFTVDGKGDWVTAKHVVDGCDKIGLRLSNSKLVKAEIKSISKSSDTALLFTKWDRPPLPQDLNSTRNLGEYGYFIGFPQGKPGEAVGELMGRRRMVVQGRYRSSEAILAWSELGRTRGLKGSLGGISGGPAFDKDGEVIGLVSAESARRGRIYTVAPKTLQTILPAPERVEKPVSINVTNYGRFADTLRRTRQVAQVYCLVE